MSTGGKQFSHIEYVQEEQEKNEHYQKSSAAEDVIDDCARALNHGQRRHVLYVANQLREHLVPLLLTSDGLSPEDFERELAVHDNGYFESLRTFVDRPDWHVAVLNPVVDGLVADGTQVKAAKTVKKAFLSCVAIAEVKNFLLDELTDEGDALGFATKLGVHKQNPRHNFGDRVPAVTDELGALKSLYTGGTGSGKSNGASAQMWDYYLANFAMNDEMVEPDEDEDDVEFKCFDPIGMSVGENVNCYDVPQAQDDLRDRREDYDLPVDITDGDIPTPETELFIPLTPDIEGEKLPYDTEDEEFVPTPFIIPASNISASLFASVIDSYVSDTKERTIRDAYHSVDRRMDDWAPVDLADEIKGRSELSEQHTKEAIRAIKSLQSVGFIRTRDCEHNHPDCEDECRFVLDLDAVMRDPETITRVSQSKMDSEFDQLVVIAYILDRVWHLRKRNYDYPTMAMWLRELWEIAPHGNARRDYPDRIEAVLEHIVSRLKKFLRKPRDVRTHLQADTQEANDVEKGIRRRFNRYVVYSSNGETLQDIFSWVGKDGRESFRATLSDEAGQGGVIGGCEPAIGSSRVWGMSPVRFTPPPWHHHDKDNDGNGWDKRVELMSHREEFRHHEWPTAIPDRLEITIDLGDDEEESFDPEEIDKNARIEIAQNLRNDGLTLKEIGPKVNRSKSWVGKHTENPNKVV